MRKFTYSLPYFWALDNCGVHARGSLKPLHGLSIRETQYVKVTPTGINEQLLQGLSSPRTGEATSDRELLSERMVQRRKREQKMASN